ncbi:four helix bundle protein [Pontibacter toksunensis]|uniref:Four helix bundle protein n=1 Tax=Pontibacter toksunensis TaxID=1332631 RepID=A0ABW6C050_9BACT
MLAKQVLRSGTSIGANIEEAVAGQSAIDFIHKMSIARKEARESSYWLRLDCCMIRATSQERISRVYMQIVKRLLKY